MPKKQGMYNVSYFLRMLFDLLLKDFFIIKQGKITLLFFII